jgi:ABC-type branched-subunit amino acid transport system ATPase component
MLELKELAVNYGSITALHDVSLKVGKGRYRHVDRRKWCGQIDHAAHCFGIVEDAARQHSL